MARNPRLDGLAGILVIGLGLTGIAKPCIAESAPLPVQIQHTETRTTRPSPETPAAPSRMTGPAAWKTLVGNTIVASSKGGSYTEFFASDGTVKHVDSDGLSKGKWALQGDKVCFDYPEEDDRSCVSLEVTGTKGVFVDEDGTKDLFDVMPGNAKNL